MSCCLHACHLSARVPPRHPPCYLLWLTACCCCFWHGLQGNPVAHFWPPFALHVCLASLWMQDLCPLLTMRKERGTATQVSAERCDRRRVQTRETQCCKAAQAILKVGSAREQQKQHEEASWQRCSRKSSAKNYCKGDGWKAYQCSLSWQKAFTGAWNWAAKQRPHAQRHQLWQTLFRVRSLAMPTGILCQAFAPHIGAQAAWRVHAAHPQAGTVLNVPVHVVKKLRV